MTRALFLVAAAALSAAGLAGAGPAVADPVPAGATPWADDDFYLPRSVAEAKAMEAADALPLTSFYTPPKPLPAAAPGTLIRSESFDGYTLPPGASAVRILYHTRTISGADVAASGVVLIPKGEAPAGGWPVVAWAHGTSGVARQCAPSLMKDVEYGNEGLMPMVAAGFAVVATDYAGLGTPEPHQYDDKIAQAADVVYSIPAAHQAVPSLGAKWATIGHSQGGVAVWGVAEMEADLQDPNYVGAVSVAGDMDYDIGYAHDIAAEDPGEALYWPLTAYGIKSSYPTLDPAKLLTPAGLAHYHDVTTNGCWYYAYAVVKQAGKVAVAKPGWMSVPEVQRYDHDSRSANKSIKGPLLIVAGIDDNSVNIKNIRKGAHDACTIGLPVEYRDYPGLDHDPLMEKTTPDQLAWVRDRLDGRPWKGNCADVPPA
jgi:alpha-beta hydrolase superfamily lysophospholipase